MKRRVLALLLAGCMVFTQVPSAFAAEEIAAEAYAGEEAVEDEAAPAEDTAADEQAADEEEYAAFDAEADEEGDEEVAGSSDEEYYDEDADAEWDEEGETLVEEAEEIAEDELLIEEPAAPGDADVDNTDPDSGIAGAEENGITLSLEKSEALVNEDVEVTVTVTNPEGIRGFCIGDPAEDIRDWDYGWAYPDHFDSDGLLVRDYSWGDEGEKQVCAAITYDDWEDPDQHWIISTPQTITLESLGEIGEFEATINKDSVKRGDKLDVTFTKADNADHYWVDVFFFNEETIEREWVEHDADAHEAGTVSIDTLYMKEGTYYLLGKACGTGYSGREAKNSWQKLVVESSGVREGDIQLQFSKTEVETCEELQFSVLAPGAEWIEMFPDSEDDRNWRWDNGEGDFYSDWLSYGFSTPYQFMAVAHYKGGQTKEAVATVNVTAPHGSLVLTFPETVPTYLTLKDSLHFTVQKPEHADGFKVEAWYDPDEEDADGTLFSKETDGKSIEVNISREKIALAGEGKCIKLRLEAWARGYDGADDYTEIPVINPSGSVKVTPSKTKAQVNEDINITITADHYDKIKDVVIWDGNDWNWWLNGDELGQLQRTGSVTVRRSFGNSGKTAVMVRVTEEAWDDSWDDDPREWTVSEPVTLTLTSNGDVGEFKISLDRNSVKRGESLEVTFTKSERADHYWVDVDRWDSGRDDWDYEDSFIHADKEGSYYLSTASLKPGKYLISGKADALGYTSIRGQGSPIEFTVTETDLKEGDVQLSVSKNAVDTSEHFQFSVLAPNADWIEVYLNFEEDKGWKSGNDGGESYVDNQSYGHSGTYLMVARAWYGEKYVDSDAQLITVKASEGKTLKLTKPADLPGYLKKGQALNFTVKMPSNGEHLNVEVKYEPNEEDVDDTLFRANDSADIKVSLSAKDLAVVEENTSIRIDIDVQAKGYDSDHQNYYIPVINPSGAATIAVSKKEALVYEPIGVTVTPTGSDEIKFVRIYDDESDDWMWNAVYNSDDFEDGKLYDEFDWGRPGKHVIYAEVTSDDWDYNWDTINDLNWSVTEPVEFNLTSKGEVGNFTFSIEKEAALRDEKIAVTYGQAEHADYYWVDIEKWDEENKEWRWYDHVADSRRGADSLYFSTGDMELGIYRLTAKAAGLGYEDKEASNNPIIFYVVTPDELAAHKVAEQIEELGSDAGLAQESAIAAARKAYDALTAAQKKYIDEDTLKTLTDAEARVASQKAEEKAKEEKAKEEKEKAEKEKAKADAKAKAEAEAAKAVTAANTAKSNPTDANIKAAEDAIAAAKTAMNAAKAAGADVSAASKQISTAETTNADAKKAAAEANVKITFGNKTVTKKLNKAGTKTSTITIKKGKTLKLKAKASDGSKVTYKTNKKKVASVSSKGVIKGLKKGKATITVKAGKKTVKVVIKVK